MLSFSSSSMVNFISSDMLFRCRKNFYNSTFPWGHRTSVSSTYLFHLEGFRGKESRERIKEHGANIKNERIRTSTLAEHSIKTRHHVHLEDTKILTKENHLFKHRIREAIEIRKHPSNLNRDSGLELSENWLPLIHKKQQ